jgi:hypothetical protein
MSFQVLTKGVGGTVETQFLDRYVTSCTVGVYNAQGSAKVPAGTAATVDTVNTTLNGAVAARATSVILTSATGVVCNRRYRIGGVAAGEPNEVVTVKAVSGTTVTLWAPLVVAHATLAAFAGTRVSYAVTSTQAGEVWTNGWATFTPTSGDTITEAVECYLTKIPEFLCDESDLRLVFPKLAKNLDAELDLPQALREARDETLLDLGGKNRAHTFLGAAEFRRQAALKFWLLRRYSFGDEWTAQFTVMEAEYERRKTELIATMPIDADQDGTTSGQNDYGFTVGRLERA